jgi:hypothetical protein
MTRLLFSLSLIFVVAVGLLCTSTATAQQKPKYTDPKNTDDDFAIQGEYTLASGAKKGPALQVIALGKGEFEAAIFKNGLPGSNPKREDPVRIRAKRDGTSVRFDTGESSYTVNGKSATFEEPGKTDVTGKRIERKSPTLGLAPPKNATVLFDGSSTDLWKNGRQEDGLLVQGTTSKPTFGSHRLHIEFRIPYQPLDRGQGRGNSGIYVQGRYEIQMLDSFGLVGKHNECGGLYSVKDPALNMCFPPLTWQSYDIEYTAAKFDDSEKLTANPRVTVRHNGVVVHDDVELPGERSTTAAPSRPGPAPGPIYLQNHGCPVRYRNIWVVETKE